jgi:hypothetical protein
MKINIYFRTWIMLFIGQFFSLFLQYCLIGNDGFNNTLILIHFIYFLIYSITILCVLFYFKQKEKNNKNNEYK